MKILIVDDISQIRIRTKLMLNSLGHQDISEAHNGQLAMRQIEENDSFDVIFLDWEMPGMNGIETLEQIRAHEKCANTRVVMLTTKSSKEDILAVVAIGIDSYLVKPLDSTKLDKCMNSLFTI